MKLCSVEECDRPHKARGFCKSHVARLYRGDHTLAPLNPYRQKGCQFPGCTDEHHALGWCRKHYRNGGEPLVKPPTPCGIPGCPRPTSGGRGKTGGRGWCRKHYKNFLAFGDPLGAGYFGGNPSPERLAAYAVATPLIRADLHMARTMREHGRRSDVDFYLKQAETHGRKLTRLEREFADGVRMSSNRERDQTQLKDDVMRLTSMGLGAKEIGRRLGVSDRTVVRHRSDAKKSETDNG